MNRFYVYKLIDPRDNSLLYIGKGTGRRRLDFTRRNNKLFYKLRSILKSYSKVEVSYIIEDNLTNEDAFKREVELIAQFNPPCNICRGGEGITPELVTGANNVNYKHIEESDYIKLLKEGKSNKEIVTEMGFTNLNIFKRKFYPNTTLKSYCEEHGISYYNTQQGSKNGNAKVFPADEFAALIKKGIGLVKASKQLELSARYCIKEYKKEWDVSSFDELKLALKA